MISEEEARAKILSAVSPLPATGVSLGDALDRFAAVDLFATIPLPPFDNSAMDGYAVAAGSAVRSLCIRHRCAHEFPEQIQTALLPLPTDNGLDGDGTIGG